MSKVYTYVIIMSFMMMMLYLLGYYSGSPLLTWLGILPSDDNIMGGQLLIKVIAIFGGTLVASIVIGSFTNVSPTYILISTFISALMIQFVGAMVEVISYAHDNFVSWVYLLVILVMAPLAIGFILACIEFWRGSDV